MPKKEKKVVANEENGITKLSTEEQDELLELFDKYRSQNESSAFHESFEWKTFEQLYFFISSLYDEIIDLCVEQVNDSSKKTSKQKWSLKPLKPEFRNPLVANHFIKTCTFERVYLQILVKSFLEENSRETSPNLDSKDDKQPNQNRYAHAIVIELDFNNRTDNKTVLPVQLVSINWHESADRNVSTSQRLRFITQYVKYRFEQIQNFESMLYEFLSGTKRFLEHLSNFNDDDLSFGNVDVNRLNDSALYLKQTKQKKPAGQPINKLKKRGSLDDSSITKKKLIKTRIEKCTVWRNEVVDDLSSTEESYLAYQSEHSFVNNDGRTVQVILLNPQARYFQINFRSLQFYIQLVDYDAFQSPSLETGFRVQIYKYFLSPLKRDLDPKLYALILNAIATRTELFVQDLKSFRKFSRSNDAINKVESVTVQMSGLNEQSNTHPIVTIVVVSEPLPGSNSSYKFSLQTLYESLKMTNTSFPIVQLCQLGQRLSFELSKLHLAKFFYGTLKPSRLYFSEDNTVKMYDLYLETVLVNLIQLILDSDVNFNLEDGSVIDCINQEDLLSSMSSSSTRDMLATFTNNVIDSDIFNFGYLLYSLVCYKEVYTPLINDFCQVNEGRCNYLYNRLKQFIDGRPCPIPSTLSNLLLMVMSSDQKQRNEMATLADHPFFKQPVVKDEDSVKKDDNNTNTFMYKRYQAHYKQLYSLGEGKTFPVGFNFSRHFKTIPLQEVLAKYSKFLI